MVSRSLGGRRLAPAWRFAFVGVLASLPATAVLNWLPNSRATVGGGAMIVGAFVAGAIAATRSADAGAAGLRAGFLGGVVGLFTFVVTAGTSVVWSPFRIAFWALAAALALAFTLVFGLLFGRAGGWVARAVTPGPRTEEGTP
jgi:hypothetical protein